MTFFILISLVGGILLGHGFLNTEHRPIIELATTVSLTVMVFCAGVAIGETENLVLKLRKNGWLLVVVPLGSILGSAVAAVIASQLFAAPIKDMLITTMTLGWYSLATVVVTKMHSVELGTIAFLSNFLREFLSFFIIPILAVRLNNKLLCVATSGAATMDSSLPVIIRATSPAVGIVAFINGLVLSLVVPFFLQFLLAK